MKYIEVNNKCTLTIKGVPSGISVKYCDSSMKVESEVIIPDGDFVMLLNLYEYLVAKYEYTVLPWDKVDWNDVFDTVEVK